MPVRYVEAAQTELLEIVRFFESRLPGLGARFLGTIENAQESICSHPLAGRELSVGIRAKLLPVFHFQLIYIVSDDQIVILAVAHTSREPFYGLGRAERPE